MVDIRHESYCEAPVDVAFAYVDDYRNAHNWLFGLSSFEPVGEQSQGVGAVFDAAFAVKPVKLTSTIRIIEWAQNEVVAFESIKGFRNDSMWRFRAAGSARTEVLAQFHYELPGGLAGRVLGKALEPVVALTIRRSDEALRREIEARYQQGRDV